MPVVASVLLARRAGHTWKEIAALSGASVRTVRRVAAEGAVTTIDNAASAPSDTLAAPRKAERPQRRIHDVEQLHELLQTHGDPGSPESEFTACVSRC